MVDIQFSVKIKLIENFSFDIIANVLIFSRIPSPKYSNANLKLILFLFVIYPSVMAIV